MNQQEAFDIVKKCVAIVCPHFKGELTLEADLMGEKILDSLDSMSFLFELETALGKNIPEIDEEFEDFRVVKIVELIMANT